MSRKYKKTGRRNGAMQMISSCGDTEVFTFGDPIPVTDRRSVLDLMECPHNGRWYTPPVSMNGIARMLDASAYHQSPLVFKRNVILSCLIPHPLFSRHDFSAWVLDYLVFGNAYIEKRSNGFGRPIKLAHSLAKFTRRGLDPETFFFVEPGKADHEFDKGSVFHIKNPSVHQEIYGMPEYLSAMHSILLNGEATLFRRNYYINGSHAGVIVYMTDPIANSVDVEALKKNLKNARGNGAFKNLFVHAPGGKKDGLQIMPFSQVAAKDEFTRIKNATRDDMLAVHRVPPVLMGVMPDSTGGFGDVEKAARVFAVNELMPVQETLKELNDWLGIEVVRFNEYALLRAAADS